jgi:hypothetical protein
MVDFWCMKKGTLKTSTPGFYSRQKPVFHKTIAEKAAIVMQHAENRHLPKVRLPLTIDAAGASGPTQTCFSTIGPQNRSFRLTYAADRKLLSAGRFHRAALAV